MRFFRTKRVDIHRPGLEKILGTLETDLLEYLWGSAEATARSVCDYLNRSRKISFNAVNTVLNRLVEKGILRRTKKEQYLFAPRYTKEELTRMVSQDIFSALLKDKKIFSIAGFAEAIEDLTDEEKKQLLSVLQKSK